MKRNNFFRLGLVWSEAEVFLLLTSRIFVGTLWETGGKKDVNSLEIKDS